MFVCRTRTRSRDGKHYFTFRLVRSQRHGAKVRQRTLLNLGSQFAIPQQHWRTLCLRVRQILDPQEELVPRACPPEVETEAQRIAARLLQDGVALAETPAAAAAERPSAPRPDFHSVDVNTLQLARPRSVGVEQAALWAAEQLGLPALLAELGLSGPQRQAALALLVGRMAAPASERATWIWLRERSGLDELLGCDFETLSLCSLYRANDRLLQQRQALESRLRIPAKMNAQSGGK